MMDDLETVKFVWAENRCVKKLQCHLSGRLSCEEIFRLKLELTLAHKLTPFLPFPSHNNDIRQSCWKPILSAKCSLNASCCLRSASLCDTIFCLSFTSSETERSVSETSALCCCTSFGLSSFLGQGTTHTHSQFERLWTVSRLRLSTAGTSSSFQGSCSIRANPSAVWWKQQNNRRIFF